LIPLDKKVWLPAVAFLSFFVPVLAQTPTNLPAVSTTTVNQIDQTRPITLQDAIGRAENQVSAFTSSKLSTDIANEDVRQAKTAFLPKITAPLNIIYTSPSLLNTTPRQPAFISADAVAVYQALLSAEGEIDTSGKLRAMLNRNIALVEAARAGSEVARRDLMQSVVDAYYGLALATAKRRGAESNLQAATEFEENQRLQLEAGEVAPVDLVRARLQTAARRDELIQARTDETVNADALRVLTGTNIAETIAAEDLLTQLPVPDEIQRFSDATIRTRPEFAQFEAEKRAAESDLKAARADLWPQMTYTVSSGFISDSLAPGPVKNHSGVQATVGLTIPIFDWGATRSRIAQAKLREQLAENSQRLAERQFVQAFYTAREQALGAQERITQLRQSITDAETNVTASTARYRSGEATITEVVDAQNTLVTQRQAFYQALFDYQIAKSRLARAAGQ
jgi:outer membrane protein TolC